MPGRRENPVDSHTPAYQCFRDPASAPPHHADWHARHLPVTEQRLTSGDGHISELNSAVPALE